MTGFQEEQTSYLTDPQSLVGQFRNLGPDGPAYQIMAVNENGSVDIEIVYSDEKVSYPLAVIVQDPLAVTIP